MTTEQGNIEIFQSDDGGEVTITGGIFASGGGLGAMAYLCLFGGNVGDDGLPDNPRTWWGNRAERDPARREVSRTETVLSTCPPQPRNLGRVQDAATADLRVFLSEGIADEVRVTASIPGLNRVRLDVSLTADGERQDFTFIENWRPPS